MILINLQDHYTINIKNKFLPLQILHEVDKLVFLCNYFRYTSL